MQKKAFSVENLNFKYTQGCKCGCILKDVNFDLFYGEITLLMGDSGCGKTSFINAITRIAPTFIPASVEGSILLNGKCIDDMTLAELSSQVGIVMQNPDAQIIYPKIEDEIAFGMENLSFTREHMKENIENAIEKLKLDNDGVSYKLSGGQQQKLIIASILSMEQKILILDEPFANLDNKTVGEVLEVLKGLKDLGYAILIVEHRLELIMDYIDRVYEMKDSTLKEIEKQNVLDTFKMVALPNKDIKKTDKLLLKSENLSFAYKDREIINDLSFDVREGEKLTILGENGSGKTTLLKLLIGVLKPSKGRVWQYIFEKEKKPRGLKWHTHTSFVYQNPNYQIFMKSVEDEIMLGVKNKEIALQLIKEFGIEDLLKRHPHSLSAGQKRKITLISALAKSPKILFLDEPTVGQDTDSLSLMIEVLNYFNKKYNMTIISTSHDKRFIKNISSNTLHLK